MRRFVSIWLPHWPTDCWRRRQVEPVAENRPLALTVSSTGGVLLYAVDPIAAMEGLCPGRPLADARSLVPQLSTASATPNEDRVALELLADWCLRYAPSVALDGDDGLLLDITGCAHLFGGEEALLADIGHRLAHARIASKAAIANTPAAAWATARFGTMHVVPPEDARSVLNALPVAALRIPPTLVETLSHLGLRRIGDLLSLPAAPLSVRFGSVLLNRLDQLIGRREEPVAFRRPIVPWRTRIVFAEPIGRREDIDPALRHLLTSLCADLASGYRGARRLSLLVCRVDSTAQMLSIGTSQASRDAKHLFRLFTEALEIVDPGFGIETMILEAPETDALVPQQTTLDGERNGDGLGELIDRLKNRLGATRVFRVAPVESHLPERAITLVPALGSYRGSWQDDIARPIRLLPCPEPVEAIASSADRFPKIMRWRSVSHRIVKAEGPERIAPEWWHAPRNARTRDYYWLEDDEGRRFWVYRTLPRTAAEVPRWYLHGLFA